MKAVYEALAEEARAFWVPSSVSRVSFSDLGGAEAFHRRFVASNTPVIITDVPVDWDPSLHSLEELERRVGSEIVSVNVTPDGHGDCVKRLHGGRGPEVFVMPEERRMAFSEFAAALRDPAFVGVPYLSHQNDSLRSEFAALGEAAVASSSSPGGDLATFAEEAFGCKPDAVNLWIGDERAVSAVHKDHYENLYCVVCGEKRFVLLPPSDVLFLYETEYPTARYVWDGESHAISLGEGNELIKWIPVDPALPDLDRFPRFRYATPVECSVRAGEILYLPALWYHRASQTRLTIAVNYWHDMAFDVKWVYYRALQALGSVIVDSEKGEIGRD